MGEAVIDLFARFGSAEELRSSQQGAAAAEARWCHAELRGRLVELSGQSALTMAMGAVLDAQRQGEPVVWVSAGGALFYPPDVAESGVDLGALILVRVQGDEAAARAADKLLRSGAFGLLVLDLVGEGQGRAGQGRAGQGRAGQFKAGHKPIVMSLQARLTKLAQKHNAAVLALTDKPEHAASLSSLVSLRCVARRRWLGQDRYTCEVEVLKDKRRGPVWRDTEELRAPAGVGQLELGG